MSKGGRLIIGIGCGLIALAILAWGRVQTLHMTEGEALIAFWPAWLLAFVLASIAGWLIGKYK